MRATNIILTSIVIAVVTILIAFVVADNAQYSNPIHVVNGVAHITTDRGDVVYSDVEYIAGNVLSVKPSAILSITVTPSALPSTSAPSGIYTCAMVDSHGNAFDVTSNTPCNDR